jgi:hypothetical protein
MTETGELIIGRERDVGGVPSYTLDDVELYENGLWDKPRKYFWSFRRAVHPDMVTGWWPKHVAGHLQQFYEDLEAGKRPKLAIMAHPQSGKSMAVTDFIAWVAGRNPNLKTIFASYSDCDT